MQDPRGATRPPGIMHFAAPPTVEPFYLCVRPNQPIVLCRRSGRPRGTARTERYRGGIVLDWLPSPTLSTWVRGAVSELATDTIVGTADVAHTAHSQTDRAAAGEDDTRPGCAPPQRRLRPVRSRRRVGPAEPGRPRLDRHQHEPVPQLRNAVLAGLYQMPPSLISQAVQRTQDPGAVAVEPGSGKAGDVLQQHCARLICPASRSACGNGSGSWSRLSCLPAVGNGGQGTPPESRSASGYARPSTSARSDWIVLHRAPLFRLSVWQASASSSPTS